MKNENYQKSTKLEQFVKNALNRGMDIMLNIGTP